MTSLVSWAKRRASRAVSPWPTLSFDQALAQFGQFTYQGLGYGPGLVTTITQQHETIQADFTGFIEGVYKSNGPVFACMLVRMLLFSEARFQWRRMRQGRPGDLFGTDDLAILENPWPNATTGDLLTRAINDADLAGNFYCTRTPRIDGRGSKISRLRPDWVTILKGSPNDSSPAGAWDPAAELVGYIYQPGGPGSGMKPKTYLPEECAHFAPIVDPAATYRGMSWVQPIINEVIGDRSMTTHKIMYFEQGAMPNLVVTMDTGKMDRETFKQWIDTFDAEHSGSLNAYKCLAPETEVSMWDGSLRRADQVRGEDVVVAWSNGHAVPGTVSRAEEQPPSPIVTVTTKSGRQIRTNDRHPFLVEGEWIAAKDLRAGQRLTVGLNWAGEGAEEFTPYQAWLLGLATGDGSCGHYSNISIAMSEPSIVSAVAARHELREIPHPKPESRSYHVKGLRSLLRQAGLLGCRSWEKRAPESIMRGSRRIKATYLSGLIDADGHVTDPLRRRSAEIGITSVSRGLLEDCRQILASLGVNASVKLSMPAGHHGRSRDAWRLYVFGNFQAAKLARDLRLQHAYKAERLALYATMADPRFDRSGYDVIESVALGPPNVTIGLEVREHHTHVTGGVVSHNTLYLGQGATAQPVGANLKDLDYHGVIGQGETRIAAAAGVPPIIAGFSEGLASATYSNYSQARRRLADGTLRPLWRNFAGSMATIVPPPGGAELWYDDRDIQFLQDDQEDKAKVQLTQATAVRLLVDAGYDPDSIVKAIVSDDLSLLTHSGLYSVQLRPPGTQPTSNVDPQGVLPSGNGNGNGNGSNGNGSNGKGNGNGNGQASAELPPGDRVIQFAQALLLAKGEG